MTTGADNEVKETAPEAIAMQEVGGLLKVLGCGLALALGLVIAAHWRERRWGAGTPPSQAGHSLQESLLDEVGRPRARRGSRSGGHRTQDSASWQKELQQARRV